MLESLFKGLVVIDFWGEMCPPCIKFKPVFLKVSEEIADVRFIMADVETEQGLVERFYIKRIPTIVVLFNNEEIDRKSGFLDRDSFKGWVLNLKEKYVK